MILNIIFLIGIFLIAIATPGIIFGGIRGNGISGTIVLIFAIGVCLTASKFIFV